MQTCKLTQKKKQQQQQHKAEQFDFQGSGL